MKNIFLKTIGTTLAIMMLALAQISVSAQDAKIIEQTNAKLPEVLLEEGGNGGRVIGTWDVQVTIRNCQTGAALRTFASVTTFMFGGTMIDSTSGIPQALKTPGHGVWSYLGKNRYSFKAKSFNFDAGNNFTGWTIIKHEATLNQQADESESFGTAEIYAPNGILVATGCSTATAARFE